MRCVGCDVSFSFCFSLRVACGQKKKGVSTTGFAFLLFFSLSLLWFVVYSLWRGEDTLLATAVVDLVFVAFCGCFFIFPMEA